MRAGISLSDVESEGPNISPPQAEGTHGGTAHQKHGRHREREEGQRCRTEAWYGGGGGEDMRKCGRRGNTEGREVG